MTSQDDTADKTIIKLNVGGTEMLTYKGTLLKYPYSSLHKLVSANAKENMMPNDPGTYFVDYSAERFQSVLDFLRTEQWPLFYSASGAQNFKTDLSHFGLLPYMYEGANKENAGGVKLTKKKRAFKKVKTEN
jgi:BTB/POZ domain